jgi:endonuclease YncB( thermonuclease family)
MRKSRRNGVGRCYYTPMLRPIILALAALVCASAGAAEPATAKVLSCYDGDTCILDREILPGRDRVRLSNADTPEIEGKCPGEIKQAIMARDYTRAMVVGRVVTLLAVQPDKYRKRIDAYVSIEGRDLGDSLIAAGLARPYSGGTRPSWC